MVHKELEISDAIRHRIFERLVNDIDVFTTAVEDQEMDFESVELLFQIYGFALPS